MSEIRLLRIGAREDALGISEALEFLEHSRPDAVLAHCPAGGWSPEDLLLEVQRVSPAVPVIVVGGAIGLAGAVRLAKLGAFQVLEREPEGGELAGLLESAREERRARDPGWDEPPPPWRRFLVGQSRGVEEICRMVRLVGPRRSTVLITGETGTGKEVVARAVHSASPRAAEPLVAVSCSALPETLLEAELFGHVRGAFTGAVANRAGRFEQAHGGTLFLDEIGEMPLELQAKLLRVLQEREYQRLGSSETLLADVRVIAATNLDLAERVRQGRFREDLYYRLNVVPVRVPPLRERSRDIPLLVCHFLEKICRAEGVAVKHIAREALALLVRRPWPGNVRQLENAVEMAVALSGDRPVLHPGDFPGSEPMRKPVSRAPAIAVPDEGLDFEGTVSSIERSILEQALKKTGGNKKMAADMLGLKRTTLSAKLRSFETARAMLQ